MIVEHLAGNEIQRARGYSPAVVTKGGRVVWLSGHVAPTDRDGRDLAHDFGAQARRVFELLEETLARAGGSLADMVSMTVYVTSAADIEPFLAIRATLFGDGRCPSSALLVVSGFARPSIRVEVQGVAVVEEAT